MSLLSRDGWLWPSLFFLRSFALPLYLYYFFAYLLANHHSNRVWWLIWYYRRGHKERLASGFSRSCWWTAFVRRTRPYPSSVLYVLSLWVASYPSRFLSWLHINFHYRLVRLRRRQCTALAGHWNKSIRCGYVPMGYCKVWLSFKRETLILQRYGFILKRV